MGPSTGKFISFLDWTTVILLGTIGNAVVGGFSGFIGSLVLRRELSTIIAIWWIGFLAGVIGGLLHAIFVFVIQRRSFLNWTLHSEAAAVTWGRGCALILSQSLWWAALGAAISYLVLVGSPFDPANELAQRIPFVIVLLTVSTGVFGITIYAAAVCWTTGSELHLLILQNTLILMGEDLMKLSQEFQDLEECLPIQARPIFLSDAKIAQYRQDELLI